MYKGKTRLAAASSCYLAPKAEHQQRDVVVGLTACPVLRRGFEQSSANGLRALAPESGKGFLYTLHAELLARWRERLGDPVAVEHDRVVRGQLDCRLVTLRNREQT